MSDIRRVAVAARVFTLAVIASTTFVGSVGTNGVWYVLAIAGFAEAMRAYFEGELADCRWITHELHERRATMWRRVKWGLSHLPVDVEGFNGTTRAYFRAVESAPL